MNLKNKIFFTIIAIIFAICLFNTNCFASTEVIVDDTTYTFHEKYDNYDFKYVISCTYNNKLNYIYICSNNPLYYSSSHYQSSTSTTEFHGFICLDSNGIATYSYSILGNSIDIGNNDKYTKYGSFIYESSGAGSNIKDFNVIYASSTIYNCDVSFNDDGKMVFSITDTVYTNSTFPEERGTNDNTNPDSGESGNETTGGDSETDTDSDDSGGILSSIKESFTNVVNFFKELIGFVGNILSYLNPFSENFILKGVLNFLGEILSYINPFSENFLLDGLFSFLNDFFTSLFSFIGDILSYLNPFSENFLGYKLIDLLQGLFEFLFIPEENSFTGIMDIVDSKFDFIDTIKIAANSMKDLISNVGVAPKLTINVNNNEYGVKEVTLIDLEWYKPYKTYGDLVLTGFIYAFFLWRLFITVPNLINGTGGFVHNVNDIYVYTEKKGGKD